MVIPASLYLPKISSFLLIHSQSFEFKIILLDCWGKKKTATQTQFIFKTIKMTFPSIIYSFSFVCYYPLIYRYGFYFSVSLPVQEKMRIRFFFYSTHGWKMHGFFLNSSGANEMKQFHKLNGYIDAGILFVVVCPCPCDSWQTHQMKGPRKKRWSGLLRTTKKILFVIVFFRVMAVFAWNVIFWLFRFVRMARMVARTKWFTLCTIYIYNICSFFSSFFFATK